MWLRQTSSSLETRVLLLKIVALPDSNTDVFVCVTFTPVSVVLVLVQVNALCSTHGGVSLQYFTLTLCTFLGFSSHA